jgi:hypothetical protein
LILFLAVLFAAVGGAFLYDHPAAQLGVGETEWSSFSGFRDYERTHSVVVEYTQGSEGRERMRYTRYPNGSRVTEIETIGSGNLSRGNGVVRYTEVQADGIRYEVEDYRKGYKPEVIEPDVYYDAVSNTVYEREEYNETDESDPAYPTVFEGVFSRVSYTRNGTQEWNNRKFTRYDVLDQRGVVGVLTGAEVATGYVLVNDENEVRYVELDASDVSNPLVYETYPEAVQEFPSWIPDVEERFAEEPGHRKPHAYDRGSYLLLTGYSQWTPTENITVALVNRVGDGGIRKARIKAGEQVFARTGDNHDKYVAYLNSEDKGISLTRNRTRRKQDGNLDINPDDVYPRPDLIFDRQGVNVYEVPIEPGSALGSVYSVTASHLLPENGGGRVLRVDSLKIGEMFSGNDSVTVTVGNKTETRSVTKTKSELSRNRFYLMRTRGGVELENSDGIVTHVTPSDGFAEKRFVSNATIEVTVDGIPIVRKPVPERATQASSEPLDELLTGVGIQLYSTPPDRAMLGHGRRIISMDWERHTLLKIHSWDYDTLRVSGGEEIGFPSVISEDQTGYYRLRDGESFRVETGDGITLYEGVANGSKTVSP